jgi:hypothetical protein
MISALMKPFSPLQPAGGFDSNARDQHVHVGGVPDGESPVGTIDVDAPAHGHFMNSARQIAQVPDRHLDTPVGDLSTG